MCIVNHFNYFNFHTGHFTLLRDDIDPCGFFCIILNFVYGHVYIYGPNMKPKQKKLIFFMILAWLCRFKLNFRRLRHRPIYSVLIGRENVLRRYNESKVRVYISKLTSSSGGGGWCGHTLLNLPTFEWTELGLITHWSREMRIIIICILMSRVRILCEFIITSLTKNHIFFSLSSVTLYYLLNLFSSRNWTALKRFVRVWKVVVLNLVAGRVGFRSGRIISSRVLTHNQAWMALCLPGPQTKNPFYYTSRGSMGSNPQSEHLPCPRVNTRSSPLDASCFERGFSSNSKSRIKSHNSQIRVRVNGFFQFFSRNALKIFHVKLYWPSATPVYLIISFWRRGLKREIVSGVQVYHHAVIKGWYMPLCRVADITL